MGEKERKFDDEEIETIAEDAVDDVEIEDMEEQGSAKMKALREKAVQSEKEKMECMENLQRTKADFLNSKRRLEEQFESDRKRLMIRYVEDILPLADSFDMSLRHNDAWNAADDSWKKGIELIHSQLKSLLARYGVTQIGAEGEQFDPALHEAVANQPVTDKAKHHTVTAVLQSGYRMNDTIVRAARVTVGEFTE